MGRKRKAKPTFWQSPFEIVIDTREQKPYDFSGLVSDVKEGRVPIKVRTQIARLETGDYTVAGYQDQVVIERKSPSDLIKTLTHRRDAFFYELDRMRKIPCSLILVEGDIVPILLDPDLCLPLSQRKKIGRTIIAIQQDYATIQWSFAHTRNHAESYAWQWLKRWHRRHGNELEDLSVSELRAKSIDETTQGETDGPRV